MKLEEERHNVEMKEMENQVRDFNNKKIECSGDDKRDAKKGDLY